MGFSATITKQPRLFANGVPTRETVQGGLRAGMDLWVGATKPLQPASIAAGWQAVEDTAEGVQARNTHPAMGPMNNGAEWPNKMPNISAIAAWLQSKGGNPKAAWIVAKHLQERGMPAKHWTNAALERVRPQIRALAGQAVFASLGGMSVARF